VSSDDGLDSDLSAFGASDDIVDVCDVDDVKPFLIWPGCLPVLLVFLGLDTQWRYHFRNDGSAQLAGLNYQSAEIEMRMQNVDDSLRSQVWSDLKIMESAAIEAYQKKYG